MQTTSFRTVTDPKDPRLVSIALWAPPWYRGRTYPALAPRRDMLKNGTDSPIYYLHLRLPEYFLYLVLGRTRQGPVPRLSALDFLLYP